jgi:hypothetical protein
MKKFDLLFILKKYGLLYSEELGIDLSKRSKEEVFKWFLASLLFGARISETIAKRTYKTFERYNLLTPQKILKAGRNFLVNPIMREGGYVRYDGKTSNEILKVCQTLIEKYKGDLNKLEKEARDSRDLEKKLQEFYSVGPVTCRIFLRELRGIWEKADPQPGRFVKLAAKKLGIPLDSKSLKNFWQKNFPSRRSNYDFRHFEVALLRLGKNYFQKGKKPKLTEC